ncbi:MAG: UDP-N-acetylmuramate dehydrogenase [Christensenellales bacterium]
MTRLNIRKLKKLNKSGRVLKNVDFSKFCTFKCGGKVAVLIEICTLDNFFKVMFYLEEKKINYFILGAGSNVLCSDNGYDGVVIKFAGDLSRCEYDGEILECGAGLKLVSAYVIARDLALQGLESGAGIPATIGGAVYMNAGAYDFEMSKVVDYVIAYVDGKIKYYSNEDCNFGYRDSVFQHNKSIILRVGLRLKLGNKENIQKRYLEIMEQRKKSQPLEFPSAGSVFKRRDDVVVSKLLDECGLKGLTMGGAMVSNKHANFIINTGKATAQEIYDLIKIIKKRVWDKTQIELQTEIKFLGVFDEDTW